MNDRSDQTTRAKFEDNAEYIAARRSYIRALNTFLGRVSDQEIATEVASVAIASLTLAERNRVNG